MQAKPTNGHPSRTAACEALAALGATPREIGQQLGLPSKTVSALLGMRRKSADARERPPRAPRASEACRRTVPIERDVLDLLEPAAVRRNISVPDLVRRLLATIADDELVDGVLDDADEIARGAAHG